MASLLHCLLPSCLHWVLWLLTPRPQNKILDQGIDSKIGNSINNAKDRYYSGAPAVYGVMAQKLWKECLPLTTILQIKVANMAAEADNGDETEFLDSVTTYIVPACSRTPRPSARRIPIQG